MQTIEKIISEIGRENLARALQVKEPAIFNAQKRGIFPSDWRNVVKALCDGNGIEFDEALVRSKPVRSELLVFKEKENKEAAE